MSKASFRNRLAHQIANFAFRFIADETYEREIEGYMVYGIRSIARDTRTRFNPPPPVPFEEDWRRFDGELQLPWWA